jgi:DNA (cytosine-5)-methyltransferase 1
MRYLSLFSGIGGFDLGLDRAGHECAGQVEVDPFCRRVLAERWPGVRRWTDVRGVGTGVVDKASADDSGSDVEPQGLAERGDLDLLVGGFPCQGLSVAGKRAGLADARSGLFFEIVRIAKEIKPTWGLYENVPGLLSSHGGRDMATVLEGLRQCWPVVGYRVLDSQYFGVPQRRRRIFFVCGPTEAGVAEVLALTEGGGGHPATGGEAGARIARCLATGTNGTRYDGESMNPSRLAPALGTTKEPAIYDTTQVTSGANRSNPRAGDPCHTLAEGGHAPLHVGALRHLGRGGPDDNEAQAGHIVHTLTGEGHDASEDGTGRGTPLVMPTLNGYHGRNQVEGQYHAADSLVRRLAPVECERLQGFPDGWTCLCQPLTVYVADPNAAALACRCPDSPRYRALGNAVTVSVIEYLGHRLKALDA